MSIRQMIQLLQKGNIVVIHTIQSCRIFGIRDNIFPDGEDCLKHKEVDYVDCNLLPGLLEDGELEYCLKKSTEGVEELPFGHTLRSTIIKQDVPKRVYYGHG